MAQRKTPPKQREPDRKGAQVRREEPSHAQRTERERRKNAKRRDNKSKKGVWIALFLIVTAFILLNYEGGILMKASDALSSGIASIGGGGGFPYSINAGHVKGMAPYQGNLLLTTDNDVMALSGSAKEIKNTHHGFSNPISVVSGGRILTYDQGGSKLMVENSSKKIFEKNFEAPIISASMGKDGSFAVATGSKEASSEVVVYSRNIKEVFKWRSSSGYIMNSALSSNGRNLAIASVSAKDGILVSSVSVFHVNGDKPLAVFDYGASVIVNMSYAGANRLLVTGDDVFSVIENNKTRTDILKQDAQKMVAADASSGRGTALVYEKFDNSQNSVFTYITSQGKIKYSTDVEGVVNAVSSGSQYSALLVGNSTIKVYNYKGELVNTIPLKADALRIAVLGSKIYVQNYTQVVVYSATKEVT